MQNGYSICCKTRIVSYDWYEFIMKSKKNTIQYRQNAPNTCYAQSI